MNIAERDFPDVQSVSDHCCARCGSWHIRLICRCFFCAEHVATKCKITRQRKKERTSLTFPTCKFLSEASVGQYLHTVGNHTRVATSNVEQSHPEFSVAKHAPLLDTNRTSDSKTELGTLKRWSQKLKLRKTITLTTAAKNTNFPVTRKIARLSLPPSTFQLFDFLDFFQVLRLAGNGGKRGA